MRQDGNGMGRETEWKRKVALIQQRLDVAQEVVEEQGALLRTIYDLLPHGLIVMDQDLQILTFNDTAERITGHAFSSVMGLSLTEVLRLESEAEGILRGALERREALEHQDLLITAQSGNQLPIRMNFAPLVGKEGEALGGVATFSDVTLIKQQEDLLRQSHDSMVRILQSVIELKDPLMKGHCERVTCYALQIAGDLGGFIDDSLRELRYAGQLHDLGMLSLPDGIWTKARGLTRHEISLIRRHPIEGAQIVGNVSGFDRIALVIRHHHERYDGRGYPDGLRGEEIPLSARILGAVEAFDARNRNRITRSRMDRSLIVKEFLDNRGVQFDPQVTDVVLDHLQHDDPEWV